MKVHVKYLAANLILKGNQQLGPLVLGDCNSAMDKKIQKQNNIQTIISIGQQAMPIKQKLPQNCKHHFFDIHDNKSQKVPSQLFDEVSKIIEEGRKIGGVLVHCYAGVSRSSTFVIAYIMQKFNKNFDLAREEVKKARNCIYPNDGFINHLKNYQKVLTKRQQQRLRLLQQQKRLAIDGSIVKTARKSIRGAVKGADLSLQKAKQINEQHKKIVHQIIVDQNQYSDAKYQEQKNKKKSLSKQRHKQIKKQSLIKVQQSSSISKKHDQKQKKVEKKTDNKIQRTTKQKVQQKSDIIKINNRTDNKKQIKNQKSAIQSNKKQKPNFTTNEKLKNVQIKNNQQKKESQTDSELKSTASMARKPLISSGQQSLAKQLVLNQHDKKMKKIYQTKVNVK